MSIGALLAADWLSARRFFREQTLAKILVGTSFGLLFFGLAFFIYFYSRTFFTNLRFYEQFGDFFAAYVLHAAVMVVLWFGLVSALVETLLVIGSRSGRFQLLASLPVSSRNLAGWLQLRSVGINLALAALVLVPAGLAYQTVMGLGSPWTVLLATALATLFTLGLGTALGYLWLFLFRRATRLGVVAAILLVAGGSYLLFELVFPANLPRLYFAPAEEFFALASALPLANFSLYSYWLVELVHGNLIHLVSLVTLVTIVWLFGLMVSGSFLKRAWRLTWSQSTSVKFASRVDWLQAFPSVLVVKDLLTIWRFRRELIYVGFQLSLSAVMFGLLLRSTALRPLSRLETGQILGLTYGWLMFFAAAYLLRFVFPLMAREGAARWLVLNLKPMRLLVGDKLASALILALPLVILDAVLWSISPFGSISVLILFTSLSILLLSLLLTLLGSLAPDFGHSSDPEKTSTSFWGLVGLVVAIGWAWLSGQALLGWLDGSRSLAYISFPLFGTLLVLLWWLTTRLRYRE